MTKPSAYYQIDKQIVVQLLPQYYSTVLEIGCAQGNFRHNVNQNCEYWGIEPFMPAAGVAANVLDKVLIGTYQEVHNQIPKEYFDLVICNDVIEHMVDHDEFLQLIKTNLSKQGCVVGTIPNVRYIGNIFELLVKKDWQYKEAGILDKTHLRFFTERSLRRTISENGFTIELFRGINTFPYTIRPFSIKAISNYLLYYSAVFVFGRDIEFLQFGFRIRPKEHT